MRSSKQISKPVARLGGQSELEAAALLKTVWWDLRLASLLTHLFQDWLEISEPNSVRRCRTTFYIIKHAHNYFR